MDCKIKIGIIGGSGLSDPQFFKNAEEVKMTTDFGDPSDVLLQGFINEVPCVLLARHGRKHTIMPSSVNYRANMLALKKLGCTHVLVSTACGSLREEIKPGDLVIIDQFIDRTTKRHETFYDSSCESFRGILHLPMDMPFCPKTRKILFDSCTSLGFFVHSKGTAVTIEGPRFSSRAESNMFRLLGGDIINMTTVPEVVLARELGLCYGAVAMATDYDCWKENEAVSVEKVMRTMKNNAEKTIEVIKLAVTEIAKQDWTEYINQMQEQVSKNIMLPS